MVAIREALHHLRRGLLAREIEEELLDVLDLECPLLEGVLFQLVFHGTTDYSRGYPGRVSALPRIGDSRRRPCFDATRPARQRWGRLASRVVPAGSSQIARPLSGPWRRSRRSPDRSGPR